MALTQRWRLAGPADFPLYMGELLPRRGRGTAGLSYRKNVTFAPLAAKRERRIVDLLTRVKQSWGTPGGRTADELYRGRRRRRPLNFFGHVAPPSSFAPPCIQGSFSNLAQSSSTTAGWQAWTSRPRIACCVWN